MDTVLCNALIQICKEHFQKAAADGVMNGSHYGTPPESMIISFGPSQNNDDWKPLAVKEAVFRYSSQGLQRVSADTMPDHTENGMYYKEAYAELSCQDNGIAYIMIQFGKRYARCYQYNIIKHGDDIQIINEKLIWVS